jgi:hypothetical protein
MKTVKLLVVLVVGAVLVSPVMAGKATDELVDRMYTERQDLLDSIVKAWLAGQSPEELAPSIQRLVDVQVRLSCLDKTAMNDSAAKVVTSAGLSQSTTEQLPAAIGLAYYRQQGLKPDARQIFEGKTYQVIQPD